MSIEISSMQKHTSPNPFALVSTKKPNGETNLAALSWWTYLSNHPATIGIALSRKGYSGELIEKNGEFGLNLADETLKEKAFLCGTCSGREINKPEKFGIELMDADTIDTKLVKANAGTMECKLESTVDVGDHRLYIARVAATHLEPETKPLFAMDGYKRLEPAE